MNQSIFNSDNASSSSYSSQQNNQNPHNLSGNFNANLPYGSPYMGSPSASSYYGSPYMSSPYASSPYGSPYMSSPSASSYYGSPYMSSPSLSPSQGYSSSYSSAYYEPSASYTYGESEMYIDLDVAGISEESIEVKQLDNTLSVTGERKYSSDLEDKAVFSSSNMWKGKFSKSISLHFTPNPKDILVIYVNGILRLTVKYPAGSSSKIHNIKLSTNKSSKG